MKAVLLIVIAALWAGYAAQKDRKPVPAWYHPAIHSLYAAMFVAVMLWIA